MIKFLINLAIVLAVLAVTIVPLAWLLTIFWDIAAVGMFGDAAIKISWTTAASILCLIKLIYAWVHMEVKINYKDDFLVKKW